MASKRAQRFESELAATCGAVVASDGFQRFIIVTVLCAAVLAGIETYVGPEDRLHAWLNRADNFILLVFSVEAIVKMAAHGRRFWRYFHDPWNTFDFVILIFLLVPAFGSTAAVMRIARVMRTLRLISAIPRLQVLVGGLFKTLPSLGFILLLMVVHVYIYAVIGVSTFRENDPHHFGDLQSAAITLIKVALLEEWSEVMAIAAQGSATYEGYNNINASGTPPTSSARPYLSLAYFASFVLIGTVLILNLVVGVIVAAMEESAREQAARSASRPDQIRDEGRSEPLATLRREIADIETRLASLRLKLAVDPENADPSRDSGSGGGD